jgi:hypothetical protein
MVAAVLRLKTSRLKTMEPTQQEQELKNAEAKALADAQASKSLEEELSLEAPQAETIESLKAQLAKEREEKENYKKGMLAAKKAKPEVEEEEVEEEEDKSLEIKNYATQAATEAATEVIERDNEKRAIFQFTDKYPALKDPSAWAKVVENYNSKAGKGSVESIKQDLEAALILAKHYGGGKVAEKEITLNNYASVSYAGSIAPHQPSNTVSESAVEMGRSFGNSVEELEDAFKDGANEIRIA